MKSLETLRKQGLELSNKEMKKIRGGYSWLWCAVHSIDIKIGNLTIIDGPVGDNGFTFADCRAAKD